MKISILGSGWLGLPLAQSFLNDGHKVQLSSTRSEKLAELRELGFESFLYDIDEDNQSHRFLNADVLIINITSKNIQGFKRLIDQINSSNLKKVLFTSSTSVYSMNNSIVNEDTQTNDALLAQIERLFLGQIKRCTILRLAGLYGGERQPGRFFRKKKLISNPSGFINLVHREDVINVIRLVVERNIWGDVFNVCSDTHPQRKEFYTKQIKAMNLPVPEFDPESENNWKMIRNEKIKNTLNYSFKHNP